MASHVAITHADVDVRGSTDICMLQHGMCIKSPDLNNSTHMLLLDRAKRGVVLSSHIDWPHSHFSSDFQLNMQ